MKKITLLSIIIIGLTFIGCQTKFTPTPLNHNNSLLWQIKKNNQPISYVFGTMHMIEEEYYNFSPNLSKIINSSEAIVMELEGMPNPIQAIMLLKLEKGTLEDLFSEAEWKKLTAFYETEFGMSKSKFIATYNNFKPFFLFQSITQAYFNGKTESYDLKIMSLAKEEDIPIIGLETFKEQLGFFDAIPNEELIQFIFESLDNYKEDKETFVKLQKIYSEQNIDELMPLMKEQSPEFMKYEDLFLTNRNKNWIPKLDNELKNKSVFIAVGAAHLFGEFGIINLLKKEGYTVVPIQK